jgi:hypothetical protein
VSRGSIEVVKNLDPTGDPGRFNLFVKQGATTVDSATDVGHNGTTGKESVNTGAYTVSETAFAGTDLDDYQASLAASIRTARRSAPRAAT